jgi:hypothetical protein
VTRKRTRRNGNQTYVPDDRLIQRYSSAYCWEPAKLAAVLSQFGRLPEAGQEHLIRCLVQALGQYKILGKNVRRITPSEIRRRLDRVELHARNLLLELGINPNDRLVRAFQDTLSERSSWERLRSLVKQSSNGPVVLMQLRAVGIDTAENDIAASNAAFERASNSVADAVLALLNFHKRAEIAVQTATKWIVPLRGGPRNYPSAKGQLIRDAITIYGHMRSQHPDSGNQPGYGDPMLRFVHAIAELYGARVRDDDIHDIWRARKSNQK